jgi:hypothetical protein
VDYPNPWNGMEPWRRAALVAAGVVVALCYVARHAVPATDMASRVVVAVVGLLALLVWAKRPRFTIPRDSESGERPENEDDAK